MAEEIGVRATIDTSDLDKGLSQYESALKSMDGASDTATGSVEHMNDALDDTQGSAKKGTWGVKEFESAINLAEKGLRILQQTLDATVGKYVEYAGQVRETARAMGVSTEEASRFLQISEDLLIDQTALKTAMRNLNDAGIQPTIENLKKMSDEYLALKDPVLQAQYAADKFGAKAGAEMQKLLEAGSGAIDELNSGIDRNLILTKEDTQAAYEMKLAQDDLKDTVDGLAISIGKGLTPFLTDLAKNADLVVSALSGEASKTVGDNWKKNNDIFAKGTKTFEEYAEASAKWKADVMAQDTMGIINPDDLVIMDHYTYTLTVLRDKYKINQTAALNSAKSTEDYINAIKQGKDVTNFFASEITKLSQAEINADITAKRLISTTAEYNALSGGQWATEQTNYKTKLQDLRDTYQEVKDKAEALSLQPNRTEAQNEELAGYVTQLDDIETEIGDVEKAHKRATDQIVLGWITAKLASDGMLDEADINFLMGLQLEWGLITLEEKAAYDEAMNNVAVYESLKGKHVHITWNYDYVTTGQPPYSPQGPYVPQSEGGQGVVTSPTLFMLGEQGEPEYYSHTPLSHMADAQMQDITPAAGGVGGGGGGIVLQFDNVNINNGMDLAEFTNGVQQVLRQELAK
jgi:hypothetical protein